eukprot:COSAG01_NODE_1236_length_11101_cov_6.515179_2_plen_158_part_00
MNDSGWVELDELLWAGNHEQAGEFKNMITEDTQTCEGKYKKTREFDSYHNYCATTNSDWAAQIDGDDRRFAAIDCDDRWAGPRAVAKTEYFAKLNDPKQGPYNITLAFARHLLPPPPPISCSTPMEVAVLGTLEGGRGTARTQAGDSQLYLIFFWAR